MGNVKFGFDIGVASCGWAVISESYQVLEAGSNIFPCADASENEKRREFRQSKRLLRRKQVRIKDFEKLWKENGFPISNIKYNNQLELRNKGLNEQLSLEELYVVLKNILKHRGISYLEDALEEGISATSDYAKGLLKNQKELSEDKFPCEIQLERVKKYGKYRGEIIVEDEKQEKIVLSNVFTVDAYRKEIIALLKKQREYNNELTEDFIEKYITIFNRKREYYVGPGNEKSRTDYGRYTTKIDPKTGEYITEDNIFEKLIGRCSVYPEETRAAGATYTAQEFDLLNDLNNLTINERKLSKEEKVQIVEKVKNTNVNIKRIIKEVLQEDIETMTGARIDKDNKEIFHTFEQYRKMKKVLETSNMSIDILSREDLDEIGNILTLNTEKEAILNAMKKSSVCISTQMMDCLVDFRKKNSKLFSKWQSFSLRIMNELIPEMYEQPKEQMQLLSEMGFFKSQNELFKASSKIPSEVITEKIYNPVVQRSVRVTINVLNALIKKYGYPEEVVIEMPRDKNEEEQKKRINDAQKSNEKELKEIKAKIKQEYGITITDEMFYRHKQLTLKLKLWNEQEGICLYSGKNISIEDLLNNKSQFEIDHIIPKSVSFDDSRSNKVLVYATENQLKGNLTPYMYLVSGRNGGWSLEEYTQCVKYLYGKKKITKAKIDKLMYREDITKIEVLKKFISRNLNDTRYASRIVLNTVQKFFKEKESGTKVTVLRGSFTSQMRKAMKLDKDREESYAHHAVDAMLICYSQMGYEAYHKLQNEFIDFEEENVLDKQMWTEIMNDMTYDEIMYQNKWKVIKENIIKAEKEVKFWHKVDKKVNRALCNQTIRGTRNIDQKVMKINKYNIYTKDCKEILKKIEAGKENLFLMYRNDPRTWEDLIRICKDYKDAENPFIAYEKDTGDCFRKYSRNHNGPRIECLKYLDGEVGSCIDISHKYGYEKNSKKVILESLNPYRTDVYINVNDGSYHLVGLKYSDFKFLNGSCIIDKAAYNLALQKEKLLLAGEGMEKLEEKGYEYQFSLYKNDIIEYEKDGKVFVERFLSRTLPAQKNYIETKPIEAAKYPKQHKVGLAKAKYIRKINTDILGNYYYCQKEKFSM